MGSNSVFLYGFNVNNPSGDGIYISGSHNVTVWACTSNGNQGNGLHIDHLSDVTADGPGSFGNNSSAGISLYDNSNALVLAWGGPVNINGNHGPGVSVGGGAQFETLGNTTINNNIEVPRG